MSSELRAPHECLPCLQGVFFFARPDLHFQPQAFMHLGASGLVHSPSEGGAGVGSGTGGGGGDGVGAGSGSGSGTGAGGGDGVGAGSGSGSLMMKELCSSKFEEPLPTSEILPAVAL